MPEQQKQRLVGGVGQVDRSIGFREPDGDVVPLEERHQLVELASVEGKSKPARGGRRVLSSNAFAGGGLQPAVEEVVVVGVNRGVIAITSSRA
ncbi:hypothetical protein [Actinoplanes sp. URMC 104]|uniref:hypothetical protein n=1 Tax=Actinoplanes sp. URMC 104 TaxID=3423409 RepID=UPI003F1C5E20